MIRHRPWRLSANHPDEIDALIMAMTLRGDWEDIAPHLKRTADGLSLLYMHQSHRSVVNKWVRFIMIAKSIGLVELKNEF